MAPLLGHPPLQQQRDAVHVAIIPVRAAEPLRPGQRVFIVEGNRARLSVGDSADGVVDPFLEDDVEKDEPFWLLLYPGTITSLRHEWSHPVFPLAVEGDIAASRQWLEHRAAQFRIDYTEMVEGAVSGDGATFGDDDGPEMARTAEFWHHVGVVTGRHFSPLHIENTYFGCAC